MCFRVKKISDGISFKSNENLFRSTATACENERLPNLERNEGRENKIAGMNGLCINCNQRVIFRGKKLSANHAKN